MNTLVHAGAPSAMAEELLSAASALTEAPGQSPATSSDSRAAFDANRTWELDRALMLQRSERRGWLVGTVGAALAVLGVMAVFAQGALRQIVEIPIVVDKATGETTIQQRLSVETVPPMEALDKHNLAAFVRAREGYSWWFLQRDFDQVARMAIPAVFAAYSHQFEGVAALQKKLAGAEEWRIHIISVRLAPSGRQGNAGVATVTFEKVVRQTDRNLPDAVTRHAASIAFEYQPKVLAREKDRIENPFGFVVTAYRSDPEIGTAPSPSAATQK